MRPRCPSVGPNGYRCRKRVHGPVPADPMPPVEVCHVAYSWQGMDVWDDETAMERPVQHVSLGYDESVVWDVDRLIAAADGKPTTEVPVRWYVDPDLVNMSHWRTVDIHTPIILIPHPDHGRRLVVVDGRHRLYKARMLGRDLIPGVVLTEDEERTARMTPDEVARVDRMHDAHEVFMARLGGNA